MANNGTTRPLYAPQYTGPRLFGAPVGDFSVFQTLLITAAAGLIAFFAATFLAIISILFLTQALHKQVDFAVSYRWIGLPAGIAALLAAGCYLGALLVVRMKRKANDPAIGRP